MFRDSGRSDNDMPSLFLYLQTHTCCIIVSFLASKPKPCTYRQKAEISVFRALGQLYYVAMCWKLSFITKLFEKTMNLTLIVHICLCPCNWSFPLGVSTPPLRFFTISRLRIYDFAPNNMLNTQLYRPVVIYGNIWEQKFLHRCSSI